MPADPYWECIRRESEILSAKNSSLRPLPPGVFEPGDFAYLTGGLHRVFLEYLESKSYRLLPAEQRLFGTTGRYCVVLKRLGADKYLVCYLATFGGARDYHDIRDPVGQYFGLPLGGNTYWPGVTPLRTVPSWRSASGGGFILAIPVVREGLQRSNLVPRYRLAYTDLHRLMTLIRERDEKFDRYAEEIRWKHIGWMAKNASQLSPEMYDLLSKQSTSDISEDHNRQPHPHHARWMTVPAQQHNLSWVLRHIEHDLLNRSIYLNTLTPKRPQPAKLPKPFFASCLRASIATITRLLR
ncbi:hypothetical protein D9615_004110 [Tricholomella constricta]|uniref:Uncharacterized protein n=1 Tax=Tricholomella constricta TaxID=117010 RepID=A0A8H5HDG9_9AGAR|nr:hypothetical protein D9615_004110 [Tricholomella constricta]